MVVFLFDCRTCWLLPGEVKLLSSMAWVLTPVGGCGFVGRSGLCVGVGAAPGGLCLLCGPLVDYASACEGSLPRRSRGRSFSHLSGKRRLCLGGAFVPGFGSHQRSRWGAGVPPTLRRKVLRRDSGICQMQLEVCLGQASEVDHIIPVSEHGTNELENLRAVCVNCHKVKTQREAQRARDRFSRKRPRAVHPSEALSVSTGGQFVPPWRR